MYIRNCVTGSVESENRPLSELSDTTVYRIGSSEVGICWNPDMWKKSEKNKNK